VPSIPKPDVISPAVVLVLAMLAFLLAVIAVWLS
jgi:hypothetical protein